MRYIPASSFTLPLNLKKLQSIARRRLRLRGEIEFKAVPKAQTLAFKLGPQFLSTTTDQLTTTHAIHYSNPETLDPADVYHEFCRAKLNECGFTTIEAASLNAMRDCSEDDPKYIRDANSSVVVVSEVYATSLLFSTFDNEVRERNEGIISRFESHDALKSLHTQMGFWGTAAVCYYKIASEWSHLQFPQRQIEQAIDRTSKNGGEEIKTEYAKINSLLNDLPQVDLIQIERISDVDSIKIVDVIVRLFTAKTELDC